MRKVILTPDQFQVQIIPLGKGSLDKVLVKHKGTEIAHAAEDYNTALNMVINRLEVYYGWKILYREDIPQEMMVEDTE